jgi:hypothetical protein
MVMRRAMTGAGCAVLAALAAGCGTNTDPDTQVVKAGDAYVLMETEEYTGDVGGQGIYSTLALVGHCVGFGSSGHEVLAVFPQGTSVTGSGERLVIHVGDRSFRLGDSFTGGTRLNEDDANGVPLSTYGDLVRQVPESCRDRRAVDLDPTG